MSEIFLVHFPDENFHFFDEIIADRMEVCLSSQKSPENENFEVNLELLSSVFYL